nr:MAG TPA: hypothetical protein [Bacteriophage sp.]
MQLFRKVLFIPYNLSKKYLKLKNVHFIDLF